MPFCPFYSTNCPESNEGDTGCKIWTHFGCCIIDKPGIPAIYTDGEEDPVDIFIIQMFCVKVGINDPVLIIYALASDGTIAKSNDITKFKVHLL